MEADRIRVFAENRRVHDAEQTGLCIAWNRMMFVRSVSIDALTVLAPPSITGCTVLLGSMKQYLS